MSEKTANVATRRVLRGFASMLPTVTVFQSCLSRRTNARVWLSSRTE